MILLKELSFVQAEKLDKSKDKDKGNDNGGNGGGKGNGKGHGNGNNNGNNGLHLGWYKRTDHPKNPGNQDPVDNVSSYEIINYVNDVSLNNAEVLMTSDKDWNYTQAYTYGLDRISADNLASDETTKRDPLYYMYDGRGSVAQLTNSLKHVL